MDLATFRVRAPEFVNTADATITAAIASATTRTDAAVFGDKTEDAIFYLAAHLLAASPTGKAARIRGEGFGTLYLQERTRLEELCAPLWGATLG